MGCGRADRPKLAITAVAVAPSDEELKVRIADILAEHRTRALATLRPDGWPQATMVGYVADDLTLYFMVSIESQKLANIRRDPRVSIAIGHSGEGKLRGLSMSARVHEVEALDEIERLNALIYKRYREVALFFPRTASSAVMRASPERISIIDLEYGPGYPVLVEVHQESAVHRIGAAQEAARPH